MKENDENSYTFLMTIIKHVVGIPKHSTKQVDV